MNYPKEYWTERGLKPAQGASSIDAMGLPEEVLQYMHECKKSVYEVFTMYFDAVRRQADKPYASPIEIFQGLTSEEDDQRLAANSFLAVRQHEFPFDERSERYCEEVLKIDPDNIVALSNLGRILARNGKVDEAMKLIERALELEPDSALAHYALGFALWMQRKDEEALAEIDKSIELDPNMAAAHNIRSQLLLKTDPKQARSELIKAIEIDPNNPFVNYNLADSMCRERKDLEAAYTYISTALRIDPENDDYHTLAGRIECMRGLLSSAEVHIDKALALNPKNKGAANLKKWIRNESAPRHVPSIRSRELETAREINQRIWNAPYPPEKPSTRLQPNPNKHTVFDNTVFEYGLGTVGEDD